MPKDQRERTIDSQPAETSGYVGAVTAAAPGGMEVHALSGPYHSGALADSQATQFLKTDGSRALTGNLTVGAGVTIDNVDISALAAVPYVTVGNSADVANERALAAAGALQLADGGAGSSATLSLRTPGTLTVATTNDSSVAAHTHAVTSSSNPGAAASLLASDASGYLTLVRSITSDRFRGPKVDTATGNLTLQPADDLLLDPISNVVRALSTVALQSDGYASQTTGWRVTYDGQADFRYLYVDEMHAKSFIADLEQALAGGQIITKSVAMLAQDFTAPAASGTTTLYVRDLPSAPGMAVFEAGDIVRLRTFTRSGGSLTIADCWGTVGGYTASTNGTPVGMLLTLTADAGGGGTGVQSWTFTRSSTDNAGAMAAGTTVYTDSIVLDYGTTGNGFYEVNAIDGAYGANSPYAQTVTWASHPHGGQTVRTRMGNLYGITNSTEYGLYAGTGSDGTTDQYVIISDDRVDFNNIPITQRNVGTVTVYLKADGESRWGNDISGDNVSGTHFAIFPVARTYNSEAIGAGDIIIGDHANGNVFWDASAGQLKFRDSTTTQAYVGTDGKIYAGTGAVILDTNGVTLTGFDGSSALYGPAALEWYDEGYTFVTLGGWSKTSIESSTFEITMDDNSFLSNHFVLNCGTLDSDVAITANLIALNGATSITENGESLYGLTLQSSGSGLGSGAKFDNTATNGRAYGIYSNNNGYWRFVDVDAAAIRMTVDNAGNVGIGTATPQQALHVAGTILVDGDGGGYAGTIGLTDVTDTSANSTGVGTVKLKGATNRDSAGFVKIYIGTTAYYVPVFAAITG